MRLAAFLLAATCLSAQNFRTVPMEVNNPYGLVIGPGGALYVCEIGNHRISRFDLKAGVQSTAVGDLKEPYEVRFDSAGNMFFADMPDHVIRRVDARTHAMTTVAGTGIAGFSGDGGPATKAQLRQPHSIVFDPKGRLLICDIGNNRVRRLDLKTGTIETWAGTGERGPVADGTPVAAAPLNEPRAIAVAPSGDMFLVLRRGNAVYRIDGKTDRIYHVAGTGETGYTGDGGLAKAAKLAGPKGIAVAPDGSLYLADTENHAIRRIDLQTGIITTVLDKLARPHGIFVAADGRIFVANSEGHRILTGRQP